MPKGSTRLTCYLPNEMMQDWMDLAEHIDAPTESQAILHIIQEAIRRLKGENSKEQKLDRLLEHMTNLQKEGQRTQTLANMMLLITWSEAKAAVKLPPEELAAIKNMLAELER